MSTTPETVLKPASVPGLKKIREFSVDERIDMLPLVVGDKLYVLTMTNTAFIDGLPAFT